MTVTTIHNDGVDSETIVLERFKVARPDVALIYAEYWDHFHQRSPSHLSRFIDGLIRDQQEIVADVTIDEFNKSKRFVELALRCARVGHLSGAVLFMMEAENFALYSRYSTPLLWCEIAAAYASIPAEFEAHRSIRNARTMLSMVAPAGVAVLPGDRTGRWIPEYGLGTYQAKVEVTFEELNQLSRHPRFAPDQAFELLALPPALRQQLVPVLIAWAEELDSSVRTCPKLEWT